jgi:hypothetical protein
VRAPSVIQLRDGYVFVAMFGRLETLTEVLAEQRAIVGACAKRGDRRVLFDNRATLAPSEALRDAMFEWAASFERSALLLESEMAAVRTNMWAVSKRASVRAFHDEQLAIHWLCR